MSESVASSEIVDDITHMSDELKDDGFQFRITHKFPMKGTHTMCIVSDNPFNIDVVKDFIIRVNEYSKSIYPDISFYVHEASPSNNYHGGGYYRIFAKNGNIVDEWNRPLNNNFVSRRIKYLDIVISGK